MRMWTTYLFTFRSRLYWRATLEAIGRMICVYVDSYGSFEPPKKSWQGWIKVKVSGDFDKQALEMVLFMRARSVLRHASPAIKDAWKIPEGKI